MANDTYSMPSPIPGMSFVYDKASDDPVGVTTPDGKEVKFGGGSTTPAAGSVTQQMLAPALAAQIGITPVSSVVEAMGQMDAGQEALARSALGVGHGLAHPDTESTFDELISRFSAARRDGYVFGSSVAGNDGERDAQNRLIIKSRATLAQHFEPQGAQISAAGPFAGTEFNVGFGFDFSATSVLDQPAPSGSPLAGAPNEQVFSFEGDALRMQRVLQYGSHQTYLVGNVTGAGISCNAAGGTVATPIANFGLTAGDIALINVGDIVALFDLLVFVTAKDQGAGTLVVEQLLNFYSGSLEVVANAWRNVQFHRFAAARTTNPTAFTAGSSGPFSFETPIPEQIVPGCTLTLSPGPMGGLYALGHTRIKSIDRTGEKHTIVLERPLAQTPYASVPYIAFWPTIWSPQLATKAPQGPVDCGIYALRQRITMPEVEAGRFGAVYSGAEVTASIAAEPLGVKQDGAWYAAWFNHSPNFALAFLGNGKVKSKRSEIDFIELFPSRSQGGNTWSGNTHARGVHRDANGNVTYDYMMSVSDADTLVSGLVDGLGASSITALTSTISAAVDGAFATVSGIPGGTLATLKSALTNAITVLGGPLLSNADRRIHAKEELKTLFTAFRTRVMNAAKTDWRIPGSHWVDPAFGDSSFAGEANGGVQASRGTHRLLLPASHKIMAGGPVETQIIWTKQWSIVFIKGEPICVTWWDIRDEELPYTFILDVIGHSIQGWAWGNGFVNRDTAHIAEHWMKVHSIDIWRA